MLKDEYQFSSNFIILRTPVKFFSGGLISLINPNKNSNDLYKKIENKKDKLWMELGRKVFVVIIVKVIIKLFDKFLE
jgi:hypothetical protein